MRLAIFAFGITIGTIAVLRLVYGKPAPVEDEDALFLAWQW